MWANDLLVGSEISWWFPNILPLESGLIGVVPKNPATRARINRNGSHSSGSEISCDTGHLRLRVGDSSRRCEEIVKNLEWRL